MNDYDFITDGNFEKHFQFFSSVGQESLKSALREHFLNEKFELEEQTLAGLNIKLTTFLEKMNIGLFWGAETDQEPFDDLHNYHSRLVAAHLMNQVHKLFSKFGDGQGLRVVRRVSMPYFLNMGGNKSKYAKYCYKDNVCYDASSERQRERSDLTMTVNAWGGPNSVDCDEFQEHRIKNLKGFVDNLHGNLDPANIEKSFKSADLQLKISEEIERAMNVSYKSPGKATSFLSDDEVRKIAKLINVLQPFSRSRSRVTFVEPLMEATNYSKLDSDKNLVKDFIERNKEQFSSWGPFV